MGFTRKTGSVYNNTVNGLSSDESNKC